MVEGFDRWTAHEMTWLSETGKPEIAKLRMDISRNSPYIVESKSMKLYLSSFAFERFANPTEVVRRIRDDIEIRVKTEVFIEFLPFDGSAVLDALTITQFQDLDELNVEVSTYQPDPGVLRTAEDSRPVQETLRSNLLRTLCPVTSQPDYATVYIRYAGKQIEHKSILTYLIGFRQHEAFHESTIERIFADLLETCQPGRLAVYGRFARRGGIDIAPFRATQGFSLFRD